MAEDQAGEQTDQESRTGRHAAPDDGTAEAATSSATEPSRTPSERATEQAPSPADTQDTQEVAAPRAAPTEHATTEHVATSDAAPTEHVATSEAAPTEHVATPAAEPTRQMERPQGPPPQASSGRGREDARRAVRRVTGLLATLLRIAGALLAVVLVAFVVLTLVGVNPDNVVAQLVAEGADVLVMRFRDLFLPADPRLALVVDYGLAALFWLVVGLVAARVVRALGRLV